MSNPPGEPVEQARVGDSERRVELDTQVDMRDGETAAEVSDDDVVDPGTKIGRYTVIDIVGAGGVGVVYAAYDPSLDRKVALKRLRRSKLLGHTDAVNQRRSRLVREAQALARLSHPNVIPVYEVETYDEQLYVVMEFVEGVTLREWITMEPRSWSSIIAMYIQAARGLAAAHAADIVHRDFKPDNVRVGSDGRARVLDFGLAAPLRESELESYRTLDPDSDEPSWTDSTSGERMSERGRPVTREGQVMGTPAYMAPEQAAGGVVDARSDQFSFCVALYEALYGVRPFRGRYDDARRFRDLSRARTLPGRRPDDLPSEVERMLVRGLSLLPERRFADMNAIIGELGSVARGSRRLWWVPISTMMLALLAVVAFYERRSAPTVASCDDGQGMLVGVWDEAVVDELGDVVRRSTQPYSGETWTSASRGLDEWAKQWSRARVRACEATHVQHQQSADLLERQIACLDLQLIRVEGTVAALRRLEAEPDALLERLTMMSLPSLDACAAANVLAREALTPTDEQAAAEAGEIRQALAAVEGLLSVGEYEQALARGESTLLRAAELGFEPLTAEAQLLVGLALHRSHAEGQRSETLLRDAAWLAQRSGHDAVLVRAAAALGDLSGEDGKLDPANIWAGLARASLVRYGSDPSIEPEVRRHLGSLAMTAGDYETALVEYGRALELARDRGGDHNHDYIAALRAIGDAQRELGRYQEASESLGRARMLVSETLGAKHPMVADVLDALANVEASRGQFGPALELHRAALAINEEIFGTQHKQVAKNLNNLAIIYDETGRYAESAETLTRARAILVQEFGAKHPDVAFVDVNLGSALQNLERHEEALQRYESALTVLEDSLGPTHMAVGVTLQNLGSVRSALKDYAGALADYERASEVLQQSFGESHPSLAELELNRAKALRQLDRHDEAVAAATRALNMREQIFGAEHAKLVEVLVSLVEIELALGHPERARELGERAVALAGEASTPNERATARFGLAKALLADDPKADARARALAGEAQAALVGAEGGELLRAAIDVWLEDAAD
jgi:tetratricopeptide (TPR) repeat protein/tRNA A-37 threonylcarbamoyl transferase component Bud32